VFPGYLGRYLLHILEEGSSAEIALVGNEGVVDIALFMGGETTPGRAVVQSACPDGSQC
jgi:hypothetical protein